MFCVQKLCTTNPNIHQIQKFYLNQNESLIGEFRLFFWHNYAIILPFILKSDKLLLVPSMIRLLKIYNVTVLLIMPPSKARGHIVFLMSVGRSVRPSVDQSVFQPLSWKLFITELSYFTCLLVLVRTRIPLICGLLGQMSRSPGSLL